MVNNYQLSNEDKKLIDGKLKEDIFNKTDSENQIRPEVLLMDYYRLNNMDFNWIILDPMSKLLQQPVFYSSGKIGYINRMSAGN
ncbi:hypothetical protein GGD38_003928 [Chitinophagaceae bacterium OAS944]|nr:hypothetical protein [Chitinophagaceae bacterium OAS944]